jgi:hypothetical protein
MALADAPEPVMLAHDPSRDDKWRALREQTYNWRVDTSTEPWHEPIPTLS